MAHARPSLRSPCVSWLLALGLGLLTGEAAQAEKLKLTVVDKATGQPIPCRLHLKTQRGLPRRVLKVPFWQDHMAIPGPIDLSLPVGTYLFEIERGPEYKIVTGHFIIQRNSDDAKTVALERVVDMKSEGWWSADLAVERPLDDLPLLMQAEDLHFATATTWTSDKDAWKDRKLPDPPVTLFDGNRFFSPLAGRDRRAGGSLLFLNLEKPLPLAGQAAEYPSSVKGARQAGLEEEAWIDAPHPFALDLPLWLASGQLDSIGLCHDHLQRSGMLKTEAGGRARDKGRFPDPRGNALWAEAIYYQTLNAGLRIPPSAGSGSGVQPNPVGYNRVYVYAGADATWETFWSSYRSGAVVVTNGPLLRPKVQHQPPGYVFTGAGDKPLRFEISLNLATRDPISYLEIVKDGKVVQGVRLDEWAAKNGRLPPVEFTESGWFLVRAVTDVAATYRFASSGPWYVQIGDKPRISRAAAQFFLDGVRSRMQSLKLDDAAQREEIRAEWESAERFWQDRLAAATAE